METAANIAKFEAQRHELEAKAGEHLAAARTRAAIFENFKLELKARRVRRQVVRVDRHGGHRRGRGQSGQNVSRSEVRMPNGPIRSTGEHWFSCIAH